MLLHCSLPLLCFLNFNRPREALKVQLTTSKVSRVFFHGHECYDIWSCLDVSRKSKL